MYSDLFCTIYNQFGWNYFPEAFAEQLLEWLDRNQIEVRTEMDLACGTGVLCGILSRHGIRASGMDFSEGMIRIAEENYPDLHFETADMITFRPEETYDLVTCTGDALNHILEPEDIGRIFQNVSAYVKKGGYFIFDILSEREGQEVDSIPFEYSDTVSAEFSIHRLDGGIVNLRTKVFENGEIQFEESIVEKIHDVQMICELLEENGFEVIQCADRLLLEEQNHSNTWYVIAQRTE